MLRKLTLVAGIGAALIAPGSAAAASLTVENGAATLTGTAGANTLVAVDVEGLGTFFGDQAAGTNNPGILKRCAPLNGAPAPFPGVVCLGITSVTLNGRAGDDQLVANPGVAATVNGEFGDDTLVGGIENDVFRGGDGTDRVAYVAPDGAGIDRSAGVRATLPEAGAAATTGNGRTGENDTIASDIEGLVGGQGDDTLTGNNGDNVIAGAAPPGTADVLTAPAGRDTIRGGGGADTLLGGDSGSVAGEAGDDSVVGGRSRTATTVVTGGEGDDTLVSNLGRDDLSGGPGENTLAYASVSLAGIARTVGINLRLPEQGTSTGNGAPGEGDVVHTDFKTLAGSNGDDFIAGNARANQIVGVAPEGTEGVTPGPPGDDTLKGGRGADVLLASTGDDTLLARDGMNDTLLICGDGTDTLRADAVDLLGTDCENVDQPSRGGSDGAKPKVSVKPRRLKLRKGRRVRLFVRCRNEKQGCKGTVRLRLGKKTVAKKKFSAKGKKRKRVTLRLSKKAVRRVRARKRTRVKVVVRARDKAGNKRKKTVKTTLRRR